MIDLEDDIFQAHCQIDSLASLFDEGATIRHCRDDVVTLTADEQTLTEKGLV